ncbi:hypothetical protein PVAP13_6KG349906 [Panicum virgatum]|uniref:Uncharacterized protein n=1 Tax=Panicum virgatum TaxID=38727 RepID=A0A8T0RII3_PANVG|nr:hypothetical protein PVAP13_6KG349906 [Panicum virgatum]
MFFPTSSTMESLFEDPVFTELLTNSNGCKRGAGSCKRGAEQWEGAGPSHFNRRYRTSCGICFEQSAVLNWYPFIL